MEQKPPRRAAGYANGTGDAHPRLVVGVSLQRALQRPCAPCYERASHPGAINAEAALIQSHGVAMAGTDGNPSTSGADARPLDDPRWWSHAQTLQHCLARPEFVPADLVAAVREEQICTKLELRNDGSFPPLQMKPRRLTKAFFQKAAEIHGSCDATVLEGRHLDPFTLCFWSPDLLKLWEAKVDPKPASSKAWQAAKMLVCPEKFETKAGRLELEIEMKADYAQGKVTKALKASSLQRRRWPG